MEVTLISLPLSLLWFVFIVSCQAVSDCPRGQYYDSNYVRCLDCSPCPSKAVIRGTSPNYGTMADCNRYDSLCPYWCSVDTAGSNPDGVRDACPSTIPSPPVPFVNVTIEDKYNETANSYTVACTIFFSNMDTPTLEWSDPSGQLLASTDTSDKWKVTQGEVTQEVMTQEVVTQGVKSVTLLVTDFQKEDEGNYSCSAQQIAYQTIFLKYEEPPTTTPPGSTPPGTPLPQQTSAKPQEISKPKGPISTTGVVAVVLGSALVIVLLAVIAFYLNWGCKRRFPSITSEDIEKLPLNDLRSKLSLETSDFQSATIVGIQACLDHPHCAAVIIIQNKKKIDTVQNIEDKDQNKFFISSVSWNDNLEVWMKSRDKKKKCIQTLSMFCLKTGNITATSAVINCPPVSDTFFLRYREKDATCSFEPVEPMQGGSKEVLNLRPEVTYCVELGTKGQTGDPGAYNWVWKEELPTESLKFQPVTAKESTARLLLAVNTLPALELHYAVNCLDDSKLEELKTPEIEIKDLIHGMEQVIQLKVKERRGTHTEFRLLQDMSFCTAGSVKDFGDYEGDMTTDYEDLCPPKTASRKHSKKSRSKDANKEQCTTGLHAALQNLRLGRESQKFYRCPDPTITKAMMDCLVDFWKERTNNSFMPGSVDGLEDIESFLIEKAMQDYTAIFTVLKRFIEREDVHTPSGVAFARKFLDAHNESCRLCKQACLLIQWHTNKMDAQSSES